MTRSEDTRKRSYDAFLASRLKTSRTPLVEIYHAVRNIPYGSTGERDPVQVIANNYGSCSGKHILLRDLLRSAGYSAEIITVFTYFNQGIPEHPDMPGELRRLIRGDPVSDFHHFVRVDAGSQFLLLDGTWHDPMIAFGFPVNIDWAGLGDTVLAGKRVREYPPTEDVAAMKVELLKGLSAAELDHRARFLRALTNWILCNVEGRSVSQD